ncbi:flagellar biosynthetic protein FliQ [Aliikangiella marina]|uniref:Flagellar biosynthetic protein FliQ n=1 Tax=Aliikangiella marina TaxID=1712262 RepID=A0A545TDR1_9GAMM|nr:flagellar biosynthetic protein FliQ [Aliikangiella marina]TQV75355.1 flagellar biosynthetic protein FliQ [Aliikangiella marina]
MTPEIVVEVFRNALYVIILLVSAIVTPGLAVGLVVAIFQAATSINEQTLSFLPRLLITLATMIVIASWFFSTLVGFANELYVSIPELIG